MPETEPRIVAAAQAKVDFYDDLRGHPSDWTEIEYGEAEAALKAADAWDTANGVRRITVDEAFKENLSIAVSENIGDESPGAAHHAILALIEGANG